MDTNNVVAARENLKKIFNKILYKEYIYKVDVLQLKQLAKSLSQTDGTYKPLLSKITTQLNGMKNGILCDERRRRLTMLYAEYLE